MLVKRQIEVAIPKAKVIITETVGLQGEPRAILVRVGVGGRWAHGRVVRPIRANNTFGRLREDGCGYTQNSAVNCDGQLDRPCRRVARSCV
jgi:hypothetical protein